MALNIFSEIELFHLSIIFMSIDDDKQEALRR